MKHATWNLPHHKVVVSSILELSLRRPEWLTATSLHFVAPDSWQVSTNILSPLACYLTAYMVANLVKVLTSGALRSSWDSEASYTQHGQRHIVKPRAGLNWPQFTHQIPVPVLSPTDQPTSVQYISESQSSALLHNASRALSQRAYRLAQPPEHPFITSLESLAARPGPVTDAICLGLPPKSGLPWLRRPRSRPGAHTKVVLVLMTVMGMLWNLAGCPPRLSVPSRAGRRSSALKASRNCLLIRQ